MSTTWTEVRLVYKTMYKLVATTTTAAAAASNIIPSSSSVYRTTHTHTHDGLTISDTSSSTQRAATV